ncbi:MAG: lipopolysaccharide biosynthesis protein [Proteobacteria bacterium]|nr:lipopolysaccharide biosynthesis protein [Pseudomonadota bacterium]
MKNSYNLTRLKEALFNHISISLYKNAYYYIAGSSLTSILNFVFWTSATKFYEPSEVGLWSAAFSAAIFLSNFSNLGLGLGLIRFLPNSGENGNNMINTCFTLSGLASFVIAIIFLIGTGFWSPALLVVCQKPLYFITFLIISLALTLNQVVQCVFMAERANKFLFFMNVIDKPICILSLFIFLLTFKSGFSILLSKCLGTFVSISVAIFAFIPIIRQKYHLFPTIKVDILTKIGSYTVGNYVSRIFLLMPSSLLPIMVVNTLGSEMNAYFYISWSLFTILTTVPISISNSLFAEGSNQETFLKANLIRSLKLFFILLLPTILVFLLIADKILLLFGHSYSNQGAGLLRIISVSIIPLGINYIYMAIVRVKKNISNAIKVSIVIAFLSFGLSYFFMLKFELIGIGIGWTLGQSIVAIPIARKIWHNDFYQEH